MPRSLPKERPIDFLYRNNQGFYTEPYISNIAGCSECMKPQIEVPYPRECTFTDEGMQTARSLVKDGTGCIDEGCQFYHEFRLE